MTVSRRQGRSKLAFRTWLGEDAANLINNEARPGFNEGAVNEFVKASTNVALATSLVTKFLIAGRGFVHDIHEQPISGNLLIATDERLGRALTVFDSRGARFKFYPEGQEAGSIWLRFPPVIFTQQDRLLFKSIVIHELQHAEDWIKGILQQTERYEFDVEKYTANVSEARALHAQLRFLLRQVGDVQQVAKLLSGARPGAKDPQNESPFGMREELIPIAVEFLSHFSNVGEGWASLLAPLAFGGGEPAVADFPQKSVNQTRPAAVYNMQQESVRHAASAVMKITQAFVFGQYVRKK